MEDFTERLVKCEQKTSSNTKRIDSLERLADAINAQGINIERMVTELSHTNKTLSDLSGRVGNLEKRPGQMWDKLIGGVVGAIASGLVVAILALVLK